MRGRKPKPLQLRVLDGTKGVATRRNTPKPTTGRLRRPSWLDPIAAREFARLSPALARLGLLTEIDVVAFSCYCTAVSDLETARTEIAAAGGDLTYLATPGDERTRRTRPQVLLARQASELIRLFAVEFGLTPTARGRIQLPVTRDGPDGADDDGVLQ